MKNRHRSFLGRGAATLLAVAGLATAAAAAPAEYELDLPANRMIRYSLEFDVRHPGSLVVELAWDSPRVLALRLDPPAGAAIRRSGPSPQRLVLEVTERAAGGDAPWLLTVRGLPSRHGDLGRLRVELPTLSPVEPAEPIVEPTAVSQSPLAQRRAVPTAAAPRWVRLFDATAELRQVVFGGDGINDKCGWQQGLLRNLDQRLDQYPTETHIDDATRRGLEDLIAVIRQIDELRTTHDPLLTYREPTDYSQRRAWTSLHQQRVAPVRRSLDNVFADLQRGYAPELQRAGWPAQFVSCLMACERYFEDRGRLGEENAPNRSLAVEQWDRVLAAAKALKSFIALDE